MKRSINYFSRALCALMLCAGLVVAGCTEGPLGGNQNTEPEGPVTITIDNITLDSARFTGHLNVSSSDLSFSQVTCYYSDSETFNINTAQSVSVNSFDQDQNFIITLTNLVYNTKYKYCIVAEVKSEKIYGNILEFTTNALPPLEIKDVNVAVDILTIKISGKVSKVDGADMSNASLSFHAYNDETLSYYTSMPIPENGEFCFIFDMNCSEGKWIHATNYTYTIRTSVKYFDIDEYNGDFQTYTPTGSMSISSVSFDSATFTGVIDNYTELKNCISKTPDKEIQVGVAYYTNPDTENLLEKKVKGTINNDGTFTVDIKGLDSNTKYYCNMLILHHSTWPKDLSLGDRFEFTTHPAPAEEVQN